MIKILLKIISFLLIILILVRIPEKDGGSLNLKIARSMLGTSQSSVKFSQKLTWFLILIFFFINCLIIIQKF